MLSKHVNRLWHNFYRAAFSDVKWTGHLILGWGWMFSFICSMYALHTQMYRNRPTWVITEPRNNMFGIAWPFNPNTGDSELWRTITIVQQYAIMHLYKNTHIPSGVQYALCIHSHYGYMYSPYRRLNHYK